jgi:hypothetical protein
MENSSLWIWTGILPLSLLEHDQLDYTLIITNAGPKYIPIYKENISFAWTFLIATFVVHSIKIFMYVEK